MRPDGGLFPLSPCVNLEGNQEHIQVCDFLSCEACAEIASADEMNKTRV